MAVLCGLIRGAASRGSYLVIGLRWNPPFLPCDRVAIAPSCPPRHPRIVALRLADDPVRAVKELSHPLVRLVEQPAGVTPRQASAPRPIHSLRALVRPSVMAGPAVPAAVTGIPTRAAAPRSAAVWTLKQWPPLLVTITMEGPSDERIGFRPSC